MRNTLINVQESKANRRPKLDSEPIRKYKDNFIKMVKFYHSEDYTNHYEDVYKDFPDNSRYTNEFISWASTHLTVDFGSKIGLPKYKKKFLADLAKWHPIKTLEYVENRNDRQIVEKYPDDKRYNQTYLDERKKNNNHVNNHRDNAKASIIEKTKTLKELLTKIVNFNSQIKCNDGILTFANNYKICLSCDMNKSICDSSCRSGNKVHNLLDIFKSIILYVEKFDVCNACSRPFKQIKTHFAKNLCKSEEKQFSKILPDIETVNAFNQELNSFKSEPIEIKMDFGFAINVLTKIISEYEKHILRILIEILIACEAIFEFVTRYCICFSCLTVKQIINSNYKFECCTNIRDYNLFSTLKSILSSIEPIEVANMNLFLNNLNSSPAQTIEIEYNNQFLIYILTKIISEYNKWNAEISREIPENFMPINDNRHLTNNESFSNDFFIDNRDRTWSNVDLIRPNQNFNSFHNEIAQFTENDSELLNDTTSQLYKFIFSENNNQNDNELSEPIFSQTINLPTLLMDSTDDNFDLSVFDNDSSIQTNQFISMETQSFGNTNTDQSGETSSIEGLTSEDRELMNILSQGINPNGANQIEINLTSIPIQLFDC